MKLRGENQTGRHGARARQGVAARRGRAGGVDVEKIDKIGAQDGQPGPLRRRPSDVVVRQREGVQEHDRLRFAQQLDSPSRAAVILAAPPPAVRGDGAPMAGAADWPMWGGTPSRNMVSPMTGLPTTWDVKTGKNVKWVAELGSQTYGNPTVAGGVVLVGTNNELMRDPKQPGDRGVLMAFREATGEFLWQATFEKLSSGRANDWPFQGIASSPLVDGRASPTTSSNRGQVICRRHRGLPRQRERRPDQGREAHRQERRRHHLDVRHDGGGRRRSRTTSSNSSPVVYGNLLYVSTVERPGREPRQHPVAEGAGDHRASTRTPASWCGKTTRSATRSCTASGRRRRSATIGGVMQVVHAQGDGWVRGYEALTGKKLWEFDTNPKDSVWPKTRNEVISTPVIFDERRLHLQRPGSGARRGRRPRLRDRRHQARRHHADRPALALRQDPPLDFDARRSRTASIYLADFSGFLHCLDAEDRPALLDARHVRRDLGLADGHRRQGLPRRRGRRRRRAASTARR